jgi:hypothetical protein
MNALPAVLAIKRKQSGERVPRAVLWLALLGIALALYFFVIEPGLDRYSKDAALASTRETRLRDYAKSGDALRAAGQTVSLGVRKFGEVAMPGDGQKRPLEFNQAVNSILRDNSITDVTTSTRTSPINAGAVASHLGKEAKLERVVTKLSFAATPEQLSAALAALEQHPLVATISELRVRQGDGDNKADRKLLIDMDVETWTQSGASSRAKGGQGS